MILINTDNITHIITHQEELLPEMTLKNAPCLVKVFNVRDENYYKKCFIDIYNGKYLIHREYFNNEEEMNKEAYSLIEGNRRVYDNTK